MNILFFLTPKAEVAFIKEDMTLRQTMEKMENHRYTCVPMIRADGTYLGTITEGDLLWAIKNQYIMNLKEAEKSPISEIRRKRDYVPANVNENMEGVFKLAMTQNFVPVVDDRNMFIGIVTRKDILQYCYQKFNQMEEENQGENQGE